MLRSEQYDESRAKLMDHIRRVLWAFPKGVGVDVSLDDEGAGMAGPGKPPVSVSAQHADVIWRYDLRDELGIFPHNATSGAVLVLGDRIYLNTANGVD